MKESASYQKMLETVQTIVKEISDPNLDLDHLVQKVETGYDLIHTMKQRLETTKLKIEELHTRYLDNHSDNPSIPITPE